MFCGSGEHVCASRDKICGAFRAHFLEFMWNELIEYLASEIVAELVLRLSFWSELEVESRSGSTVKAGNPGFPT